jgi:hypothetical protein
MDVEDSRIEWKEAQALFYKVATIRIPRQVFDTPEQNEFCEINTTKRDESQSLR